MTTDSVIVLTVLCVPVLFAVWLFTRRRRRVPPLTEADVDVFALEIEYCDDPIAVLEQEKR